MSYELLNKLRGPSTIKLVDSTTVSINLSQLSVTVSGNTQVENVYSAAITSMKWSLHPTTGSLQISRQNAGSAANVVANVFQTGSWKHDEVNIANSATGNIIFTMVGPGSAFITLSKVADYNVSTQF
jgi:hypothetical protein